VVTSSYDSEHVEAMPEDSFTSRTDAVHVALWGGQFNGQDVTFAGAPLDPGHYTFGYWDQDNGSAFKGWVRVNTCGNDLIDTLRQWKAEIPRQKQWLASDFELRGRLQCTDAAVFQGFARRLRAFDRLERQIDDAIRHEQNMQVDARRRQAEFLHNTEILVMPSDDGFFHPTTLSAYSQDDLNHAQSGEAVSKLLMVADYQNDMEKLRVVNRLCNELRGCRSAMSEEVDRLERHKGYLTITDHIYHHDRKFVENEMRLQQALSTIDRLNEQIDDMRERRLALAFATELVAPDRMFSPLNEEQRDLEQEKVVLDARKNYLDRLFSEADENSPRRIVIERRRQRIVRAIESIDRRTDMLAEARDVLNRMKDSTVVIHRQGDNHLIAATFVEPNAPFRIREAIEREALMALRIQATDDRFAPTGSNAVRVQTTSFRSSSER